MRCQHAEHAQSSQHVERRDPPHADRTLTWCVMHLDNSGAALSHCPHRARNSVPEGGQMVNRQRIALAVLSAFSLVPITAHSGAGGTPTAPGAGKSSDYCCQTWSAVRQGEGSNAFTFFNGTSCFWIADGDTEGRNSCRPGTVAKCRGEFFTPAPADAPENPTAPTGTVTRCLTP